MYGIASQLCRSQSKGMPSGGRRAIAPRSGIPEHYSGFEISIQSPYPQVGFFQALPFGPLLFRGPGKRPAFDGALFSGCAGRQWNDE